MKYQYSNKVSHLKLRPNCLVELLETQINFFQCLIKNLRQNEPESQEQF